MELFDDPAVKDADTRNMAYAHPEALNGEQMLLAMERPAKYIAVNLMRDPKKGKAVSPNDFNPFAEKPQKIVLNGRGNARRPQGGIHQTSPQVKGHDEKNHRTKARKITERKLEKSPNGLTSKAKP